MNWFSINHKKFITDFINKTYSEYKYSTDDKNPCKKSICDTCAKFCTGILNDNENMNVDIKNCNCKKKVMNKFESFLHQNFLSEYYKDHSLEPNPVNRGLLIYHGLGSGKTCTSLMIAKNIRKVKPNMKIIILIQARLEIDPWKKELFSSCGLLNEPKSNYQNQKLFYNLLNEYNIHIVHYNAFNVLKENIVDINFNNSIIIMDETHNFLKSLRNIDPKERLKNPSFYLYSKIVKSNRSKLILLSGTPIYNHPVELSYLFNMLTGDEKYLTINIDNFNNKFYHDNQLINKNLFLNKIHGMVSYFKGASDNAYAKKTQKMIKSDLTIKQSNIYDHLINETSKMKYNLEDGTRFFIDNFAKNKNRRKVDLLLRYDKFMRTTNKENEKDNKNFFLINILEVCNLVFPLTIYNKFGKKKSNFKYLIDEKYKKNPTDVYNELNRINFFNLDNIQNYSSKFYKIYNKIKESNGPVIVYSFFRELYGIHSFTEFLKAQGYKNASEDGTGNNRFMVWSGQRDKQSENLKDIFNQLDNADGSKIKVFCMTTAGAEGIDLKSIRQIHLMEPTWNYVIMKQIMGRGLRVCSHSHLPLSEQKLDVFLYYGSNLELTMTDIALKKYKRNLVFDELLKISAVDCYLNDKRNNLNIPCYSYDNFNDDDIINTSKPDDYNINLFKEIQKNGKKYYMDQTPLDNKLFKIFEYEEDLNTFLNKKPVFLGFMKMKHEDDFEIDFISDVKRKLYQISDSTKIDSELKEISNNLNINIQNLNQQQVTEKICDVVREKIIEKKILNK